MLTECWSCKVRNITFLQYGLVAHNLLGRSWLSNIVINLTNTRSNTFLHYHGISLTFKNLSDISYSYHLIVLNAISVYSQDGDFQHIPYIDSVPQCVVIDLLQTIFDVTIILNNSHFHNLKQKVLLVNAVASDAIATFNLILIENCIFENITQEGPNIMILIAFEGFNKILRISNCTFRNNGKFFYLIGINDLEIAHTPVYNTSNMKSNTISIKACIALNNKCGFLVVENMKYLPQYKTNIFILGPLEIAGATAFRSDLVTALLYFGEVDVHVMGPVTITKIYGFTIMNFIASEVTFGGDIIIYSSICNQVIHLQSNVVYLKLEQNSTIIIFNTSILNEIIAVDNDQYNNPYLYCIFQFISSQNIYTNTTPSPTNYRILFYRNFIINAKEKEKCKVSFYHYISHCQWINSSVFHGYNPTIINEQIVQHESNQMNEHTTICFCSNNVTDCSLDVLGQVYPGQTLQVELCVPCIGEDATLHVETHHRSLPTSACKIAHQNQLITPHTSILNFTIVSNATETCELFLTVSPFLYRIYEAFYVRLQPCPIGFVLQNGICDCNPVLISNKFVHIETCEIDQLTIKRPPNSWIVPLTSDNSTYSLCSNCPMDYCLPHSSDLNLQYPNTQCQFNRTGTLCSQCQHSLSMAFGSSRCIPCTNIHALISIAILFAGMSLVVTLYLLNLTVINGTITGVIFYANIISINDFIFLANDNTFAPLRVFISFVNLDLGIETCFYNGMDGYTKMFLRLFFPLYVITIATSIIAISHYWYYDGRIQNLFLSFLLCFYFHIMMLSELYSQSCFHILS